jgi:hypothetical protein
VENLLEKKMVVLVDEEILKNHLAENAVKLMIEVEDPLGQMEIDQTEILAVIENLQDLEENEEKENKLYLIHKKNHQL